MKRAVVRLASEGTLALGEVQLCKEWNPFNSDLDTLQRLSFEFSFQIGISESGERNSLPKVMQPVSHRVGVKPRSNSALHGDNW